MSLWFVGLMVGGAGLLAGLLGYVVWSTELEVYRLYCARRRLLWGSTECRCDLHQRAA